MYVVRRGALTCALVFALALSACGGGPGSGGAPPVSVAGTASPTVGTTSPPAGSTASPLPATTSSAGAFASATPRASGAATAAPVATPLPTSTPATGATASPMPGATLAPAAIAMIPTFPKPLTHHGRWLVDADGRVVIFHGINVAYKSPPYTPEAQGFTQADAAMLAREGFSTVRLWIWWSAIEPTSGTYDDTSLAATKQFVGWLNDYGITVHLNFAQVIYADKYGGIGFPDWAADDMGLPSVDGGSDVYSGISSPAVHAAFDNFYANAAFPGSIGLEDQFGNVWKHVIRYFAGTPNIVAYDLVNEPEGGTQQPVCATPAGCPAFDALSLTPFDEKIVVAIRTVDPVTMIDYEPEVLAATGLAKTEVGAGSDPNLDLTFHYYPQTDEQLTTTAPVAFSMFQNDPNAQNDALLLSEFGATDDLTQIGTVIDTADAQRLGWIYWAFYSTEPTGNPATPMTETINPQEGIVMDPTLPPAESNLKTAKLDVLDRPYPFLINGDPTAWNFATGTNTFTLSYATTLVNGGAPSADPTVIVVPARLYPKGYVASATGATITSPANASQVTVRASAGAANVTVTIAPAAATSARVIRSAPAGRPRR